MESTQSSKKAKIQQSMESFFGPLRAGSSRSLNNSASASVVHDEQCECDATVACVSSPQLADSCSLSTSLTAATLTVTHDAQPGAFYSWSTFSTCNAANDIGVIFENNQRRRENLYKLTTVNVTMKLILLLIK